VTSLLTLIGVLHANYWGGLVGWMSPWAKILGGLEPLGPHEVGAYVSHTHLLASGMPSHCGLCQCCITQPSTSLNKLLSHHLPRSVHQYIQAPPKIILF